jgi:hypothetical protein
MKTDRIIERITELVDECIKLQSKISNVGDIWRPVEEHRAIRDLIHDHEAQHGYRGLKRFKERFKAYHMRSGLRARVESLARDSMYIKFHKGIDLRLKQSNDIPSEMLRICGECAHRFAIPVPLAPSRLLRMESEDLPFIRTLDPSPVVLNLKDPTDMLLMLMHLPGYKLHHGGRRILVSLDLYCPEGQWQADIRQIIQENSYDSKAKARHFRELIRRLFSGRMTKEAQKWLERKAAKANKGGRNVGRKPKLPHNAECKLMLRLGVIDEAWSTKTEREFIPETTDGSASDKDTGHLSGADAGSAIDAKVRRTLELLEIDHCSDDVSDITGTILNQVGEDTCRSIVHRVCDAANVQRSEDEIGECARELYPQP